MFIVLGFILILCVVNCEDQSGNYYVVEGPEPEVHSRRKLFKVFWNVPTMQCKSKGIKFTHLTEKYGIIQNEGDRFIGGAITILYDPGIFPALLKNESDGKLFFRNGGVPQDGDLKRHLTEFEAVIEKYVPPDFKGIGVIDFESWRPIFRQNFGALAPYKQVSLDLERSRHPYWPSSWIQDEAVYRFETAGERFMLETLLLAKRLREGGRWGYYAFPYCFNANSAHGACASKVPEENDRTAWLWEQSTGIFPSLYSNKDVPTEQLQNIIKGRIKEARRIGGEGVQILPYFWYKYQDSGFMAEQDLRKSLDTLHRSDADGVILWGSSNDVNTLDKCRELYRYVKNILGPAVARHTRTVDKKSELSNEKVTYMNVTDSYNVTLMNKFESNNNLSIMTTNNFTKTHNVEVIDDDTNLQNNDDFRDPTLLNLNTNEAANIFEKFLKSLQMYNFLNKTDLSILNQSASEGKEKDLRKLSECNHSKCELNMTILPTESLLQAQYKETTLNYFNNTSLVQKDWEKALYDSLNESSHQNVLKTDILSSTLGVNNPGNHEIVKKSLFVSNTSNSVLENYKMKENIIKDLEPTTISPKNYSGIVNESAITYEFENITEKSTEINFTTPVKDLSTVEISTHENSVTTKTLFEPAVTTLVRDESFFATDTVNLTTTDEYLDSSTLSGAQDSNSKQSATDESVLVPYLTNDVLNDKEILNNTMSDESTYKQDTNVSTTDSVDISFENEDAIEIYSNFTEVNVKNETVYNISDYFYPFLAV